MNLRMLPGTKAVARALAFTASLGLTAGLLTGCTSTAIPAVSGIAGTALSVPVLITDAPSDQLVAFTLTLNSILLTDSAGKTTSILSTPTTIEVCHLNGVQEALVTASIPTDTYVSATFTFSNPQITYINSSGTPVAVSPTLTSTTYTATFAAPIAVTNTSSSLLVDLIASQSVTISGTTVTVNPVFSVKAVPTATAPPVQGNNGTGMQQLATVVSVSGTSVVVQTGSGSDITLTTNSSTVLQGFSSLSSLTAGALVQIDFVVEAGGVYLASRIALAPPNPGGQPANQLTGSVTAVTSTGFKMAVMQGLGPSVPSTSAGTVYTVTTSASTTFAISPQFVSLTGLPFTPTFTSANLTAGQNVAITTSAVSTSADTATASTVYLAPQTLDGTVTATSTSGSFTVYTVTLASGSAFSSLSGATTVTIYTSTATTVSMNSTPIAVGGTYRFNGLVFKTASGFSMVAGVCPDGTPH